jgi:hypothetical protein
MGKFSKIFSKDITESLKKVGEHENGKLKATVHHDAEWNEYRVKFHRDGVHQKDADYHTDDKEDAHGTAKHFVSSKNESIEESLRKVAEFGDSKLKSTIHHDAEYQEYRVKFHRDGVHQKDADYHTDDKHDAISTAKHFSSGKMDKQKSTMTESVDHSAIAYHESKNKFHSEVASIHARSFDDHESRNAYLQNRKAADSHSIAIAYHKADHPSKDQATKTADIRGDRAEKATKETHAMTESLVDEMRDSKSEYSANADMDRTGDHHIYVKSKGKKKSISGPFKTKEDAEKHPSRKFGDGVCLKCDLNESEDKMLVAFNEKTEEFKPHQSDITGRNYHTDMVNSKKIQDMKHMGTTEVEMVHHDGRNLVVKKYEAMLHHKTVHLTNDSGDHVDSFKHPMFRH